MRTYFTILMALLLSFPAFSQQKSDTMYVHLNNGSLHRIAVVLVDSITFVAPSADTPATPSDSSPKAIDLGLSVKWANCNVGATSPEDYGGYYAWGETEEKSNYDWFYYKWVYYGNFTKYCTESDCGAVDNKTVLEPKDDVAHVKWGGSWRMPTNEEQQELIDKCSWSWTEINGVNCYKVTGPNGNSILLPAAGSCVYGDGATDIAREGLYWSASLYDDGTCCSASALLFYSGRRVSDYYERSCGFSVRPVSE